MNIDISHLTTLFYETLTFDAFLKFAVVYFFIIWIAILLWVIKDISNRTTNIWLQIISIFTILFLTPFGIFIYLIIRPGKTLFEKYYQEIEYNLDLFNQIIDEKTKSIEWESHCHECNEPISIDFKFCPKCKANLKKNCKDCNKIIYSGWNICPYCWVKNKVDKLIEKKKDKKKDKKKNKKN